MSNPYRYTPKQIVETMSAYREGDLWQYADITRCHPNKKTFNLEWVNTTDPNWNWCHFIYRKAPKPTLKPLPWHKTPPAGAQVRLNRNLKNIPADIAGEFGETVIILSKIKRGDSWWEIATFHWKHKVIRSESEIINYLEWSTDNNTWHPFTYESMD